MDRSNAMNHTCFWNSLHLDRSGISTICCMPDMSRKVLGDFSGCNTARDFEERVYNSPAVRALRRKVLAGKSFCRNCTRPLRTWRFQDCDYANLTEYAPVSMLKHLEIMCGTLCNANCMMCDQNHRDKNAIDYGTIKTFMSEIQPENILLYGGEVYYVPGGREFLTWCLDRFPNKVEMYTNGNLPADFAEKLIKNAMRVAVSILGAHKTTYEAVMGVRWEVTRKFVDAALEVRRKDPSTAQLVWHFTMTPANAHEVPHALRMAGEMGFDVFRASHVLDLGQYLVAYPALLYRISREITQAKQAMDGELVCETDELERLLSDCRSALQEKAKGKREPQLCDVIGVRPPAVATTLRKAKKGIRYLVSGLKRT